MEENGLTSMSDDPLGCNFKRNSWKSRSFGYHRPKTIVEENDMRPDRTGIPKRNGKKKILGGLRRIRQKSCSFEDEAPTHDISSTKQNTSNAETQSFISLAASSELFEGLKEENEEGLQGEGVERRGGRLIRSQSYVVGEKGLILSEDYNTHTIIAPKLTSCLTINTAFIKSSSHYHILIRQINCHYQNDEKLH
jgi:hypothetical protein